MGCDIHMVVQAMEWWSAEEESQHRHWRTVIGHSATYAEQNYVLFACLAGVRDKWDIVPISQPRGIPADFLPPDEDAAKRLGHSDEVNRLGDHSFSWLTPAEIFAYDWDAEVTHTGIVAWEEWQRVQGFGGRPDKYNVGIFGGKHIKRWTQVEAKERVRETPPVGEEWHVTYFWKESHRKWCQGFLDWLKTVIDNSRLKNRDEIRLVFGFDS